MTKRDSAVLACRVLALFMVAQTIPSLIQAVVLVIQEAFVPSDTYWIDPRYPGWQMVLTPILTCAVAALVWWQAPWLGGVMVGELSREEVSPPSAPPALGRVELTQVALSVLGMYLLLRGFSGLIASGFRIAWAAQQGFDISWPIGELMTTALLAGLGGWLVLGSRGFVSFIESVRWAGLPQAQGQPSRQEPAQEVPPPIAAPGRFLRIMLLLILAALLIFFVIASGVLIMERLYLFGR